MPGGPLFHTTITTMSKKKLEQMSIEELKKFIDDEARRILLHQLQNLESIITRTVEREVTAIVAACFGLEKDSFDRGWKIKDSDNPLQRRIAAAALKAIRSRLDKWFIKILQPGKDFPKSWEKGVRDKYERKLWDAIEEKVEAEITARATLTAQQLLNLPALTRVDMERYDRMFSDVELQQQHAAFMQELHKRWQDRSAKNSTEPGSSATTETQGESSPGSEGTGFTLTTTPESK